MFPRSFYPFIPSRAAAVGGGVSMCSHSDGLPVLCLPLVADHCQWVCAQATFRPLLLLHFIQFLTLHGRWGLVGGVGALGRLLFPSQAVVLLVQSFLPVFQSSSWGYLGGAE